MSVPEDRMYELTMTLSVDAVTRSGRDAFIQRLADAMYRTSADYPQVRAFFVAPEENSDTDIAVGLRFQAINTSYIDEIASDMLDEAMTLLAEDGQPVPAMEREASALVIA